MEKVEQRLSDLLESRIKLEKRFVVSLRYNTDNKSIDENIIELTEMRGRIQELTYLLPSETVNEIKKKLGVDLD